VETNNAIGKLFCSHRQPQGAALAPNPSTCVELSSSQINKTMISFVSFSLKQSFFLSLAILFYLRLSSFLSGATAIFPLYLRTQRRSVCFYTV